MSNKEVFEAIKLRAGVIANNDVLNKWENNPFSFDHESYCCFIANMNQWLAPTAYRLTQGLKLLENQQSDRFNPIVEAFEHNILDEAGDGDADKAHAQLFIDSSDIISRVFYDDKLTLNEDKVTEETYHLHNESIALFSGDIYTMLGAAVAQETHALPQLEKMYAGIYKYKERFSGDLWKNAADFYDVHLDGTEARHAEDLNNTIWEILDTEDKMNRFSQGSDDFLQLLSLYWKGLSKVLN